RLEDINAGLQEAAIPSLDRRFEWHLQALAFTYHDPSEFPGACPRLGGLPGIGYGHKQRLGKSSDCLLQILHTESLSQLAEVQANVAIVGRRIELQAAHVRGARLGL